MKSTISLVAFIMISVHGIYAQTTVKQEIEAVKNRITTMSKSVSEIRTNTNKVSQFMDNANGPLKILTANDFLSADMLENMQDAMQDMKEYVSENSKGVKQFAGNNRQCNPGTPCYKFKNDISSTLDEMMKLKSTLVMNDRSKLNALDQLKKLINKSNGAMLYPVYVTVGPILSEMNERIRTLSKNTTELVEFSKYNENGSNSDNKQPVNRPGFRRGPVADDLVDLPELELSENSLTANYFNPYSETTSISINALQDTYSMLNDQEALAFDTTITEIELSNLCSRDRSKLGTTINGTRIVLNVVNVISKFLQAAPDKDITAGGSFVGEITTSLKLNPQKRLGLILESIVEITDQLLDFASGNVDKCDYMQSQKIIADNQQIILNNQKILFEMLADKDKK